MNNNKEDILDIYVDLAKNNYYISIDKAKDLGLYTGINPKEKYVNAQNICGIKSSMMNLLTKVPNLRLRNIYLQKERNYITAEELRESFKKFDSGYKEIINNIDSLSMEDKKLFVIYSLCKFNLGASNEMILDIVSDKTKKDLKIAIDEIKQYSPNYGIDIRFMSGVTFRVEIKDKVSIPLNKEISFKKFDEIDINQIINIAQTSIDRYYRSDAFLYNPPEKVEDIALFSEILNELNEKKVWR